MIRIYKQKKHSYLVSERNVIYVAIYYYFFVLFCIVVFCLNKDLASNSIGMLQTIVNTASDRIVIVGNLSSLSVEFPQPHKRGIMKNSLSAKNVTVVDLLLKSFFIWNGQGGKNLQKVSFDELTLEQRGEILAYIIFCSFIS